MGDDDWDLYAVVRSCCSNAPVAAVTSSAPSSSSTTINSIIPPVEKNSRLISLSGERESSQGLEEIYQSGPYQDQDVQSFPDDTDSQAQHNLTVLLPSNSALQPIQSPGCTPDQIHGQPQLMQPPHRHPHLQISHDQIFVGSNSLSFPSTSPQPIIRPRRRKNQQVKMIHRLTQEELSADSWAWRKYGQKPIKGSPYPRNYYKCSTSKGCAARKQVERCPTDTNMYVVSYCGEHSHPRPTHRSSLAGSTRSTARQSPCRRRNTSTTSSTCSTHNIMGIASSSPASASSFSPTTTTTDPAVTAGAAAEDLYHEVEGWDDQGDDDDDDAGAGFNNWDFDDTIIPNYALVDDYDDGDDDDDDDDDHVLQGIHFKD